MHKPLTFPFRGIWRGELGSLRGFLIEEMKQPPPTAAITSSSPCSVLYVLGWRNSPCIHHQRQKDCLWFHKSAFTSTNIIMHTVHISMPNFGFITFAGNLQTPFRPNACLITCFYTAYLHVGSRGVLPLTDESTHAGCVVRKTRQPCYTNRRRCLSCACCLTKILLQLW